MAVSKLNENKLNENLEQLFKSTKEDCISYEMIAQTIDTEPTMAILQKIKTLCKTHKKQLISSSEMAKNLNEQDKIQADLIKQKNMENV